MSMRISVAVAGARGRMGSQMVKSIIDNPTMELVAGF
ncbi:4-hydroxy-tetrahydrodipicolinate reductase, partial [Candidatus Bathyarchaeota archaeon]